MKKSRRSSTRHRTNGIRLHFREWGLTFALIVAAIGQSASAQDATELMTLLQDGNHVGLMRHSTAPGSDDPPNFQLGDCSRQRNLSQGGRDQAIEIGERLRESGITEARIMTSQWCRCVDTAELLDLGEIEELPSLNSLYSYPGEGGNMTRETEAWIAEADLSRSTILVTHQINVSSLARRSAEEGDIVVAERAADGSVTYVGHLRLY